MTYERTNCTVWTPGTHGLVLSIDEEHADDEIRDYLLALADGAGQVAPPLRLVRADDPARVPSWGGDGCTAALPARGHT